ncbi:MAG: hypothetical protein UT63_C0046G0006 [Candidatus Gottesmanbacteria bacterium GW2011_GWC2_39_8]|uniref:Four helix bundle protein n=1 Tax=Candidatus Gottesmanbacteria bacterium GW2011_GWC2_39_8 TaxID=1618450 RepID=A0A0G0Q4N4_9BACT|nr:MAG: hypothetical protein UT63_C0046G0006 [Candidatus Gottesmanbacteria bacterium GW2011_GWC2_39_8]
MSNLTNLSNLTNKTNFPKKGGYQNLLVYKLAEQIHYLNYNFCQKHLPGIENARTRDQMYHASRSGKQNIVEGSLEKSWEGNIKLTGVARASYGELQEDYRDFLIVRNLPIWDKYDPRVQSIRAIREDPNSSNLSNLSNWTNSPENYANLMITLLNKECYLLDRLLESQEKKFVQDGGFRENLFRKRMEYKKKT